MSRSTTTRSSAAATRAARSSAAQAARTSARTRTLALAPAPADLVPEVTGSQAEYERFLAEARALDAREVKPFRADASLAYHNVSRGAEALLAQRVRLAREVPGLDLSRVQQLPRLALAVIFAASQVDRGAPVTRSEIRTRLARAHVLRDLLLSSASAAAKAGLIPLRKVEKVREGRGQIDVAQDCVDLAALFTEYASVLRGKTAVSSEQVREAATVGTELLSLLKPMSARRTKTQSTELTSAVDARDRLWTLLVRDAEQARRAGFWLWGEDGVDAHVPRIQAHRAAPRATKKSVPVAANPSPTPG